MRKTILFTCLFFLVANLLFAQANTKVSTPQQVALTEGATVSIRMNAISQTMSLKSKATNEVVEVGSSEAITENYKTFYKYTLELPAGTYILTAYAGTKINGTMELNITADEPQEFQICTFQFAANTSNWTTDEDYTIMLNSITDINGVDRNATLGKGAMSDWRAFVALEYDTYSITYIPSEAQKKLGYPISTTTGVITDITSSAFATITTDARYTVTAPAEATVYVGTPNYSGYYYRPFTEVEAVEVVTEGETSTHTFFIKDNKPYVYRISQPNHITYAAAFTKSNIDSTLIVTAEMLEGDPKTINHDPSANNGFNVSDIYLNINEKGHLQLTTGNTYQIVNIRAWQTVNNITANLFIEPDYHYTVINENGDADATVVTINEKGLLTAQSSGTAIVLITYDAINVQSAAGGPFFSALWPENTGVFVVTVDEPEANIHANTTINETLNASTDKMAGIQVDAELDVFYYLESDGSYSYTFSPEGVTSVTLAQPIVGSTSTTYNGFSTTGVSYNQDGSYTLNLINGRNIVKLSSETGSVYQVFTAKSVTYNLTNNTRTDAEPLPGDAISIQFSTLYHPATKLAGVYNMNAYTVYTANNEIIVGTGSQYTFASKANCQTINTTIPADWDINTPFILTEGVMRAGGTTGLNYGDPFGSHRNISLEQGLDPNFTASLRIGYFGALPNISIPFASTSTNLNHANSAEVQVYPNPFVDYLVINASTSTTAFIYTQTGTMVMEIPLNIGSNYVNAAQLTQGIYVLKVNGQITKLIK